MPALMRPNPVRANLQAGGNVYGTMAFEFFSTCIALERIALKEGPSATDTDRLLGNRDHCALHGDVRRPGALDRLQRSIDLGL